jgi:hypothetical protein
MQLPPRSRPLLRRYITHPWTAVARHSPAARRWLDRHRLITPHFSWAEMADTRGPAVPKNLRKNAIRHAWNLERFRHQLELHAKRRGRRFSGVSIDGPYRTPAHNREIGGAVASQHMQATATDHFQGQVSRWAQETGLTRGQILTLAEKIFRGVGNENSGTLHLDSRKGPIARFVTWQGSR